MVIKPGGCWYYRTRRELDNIMLLIEGITRQLDSGRKGETMVQRKAGYVAMVEMSFLCGADIQDAIREAILLCLEEMRPVGFTFNGTRYEFKPGEVLKKMTPEHRP